MDEYQTTTRYLPNSPDARERELERLSNNGYRILNEYPHQDESGRWYVTVQVPE